MAVLHLCIEIDANVLCIEDGSWPTAVCEVLV